jgi:hypothetical protein
MFCGAAGHCLVVEPGEIMEMALEKEADEGTDNETA